VDKEDRLFLREVGAKAARVLKTKNVRLWKIFKQRCEENGEKPESVLGRILLRFAKSVVEEDSEFAEDLLGRTIKLSALVKRDTLLKKLDELVEVKEKIATKSKSKIDELIEKLIEKEIERATSSPLDVIQQQPSQPLVIDANLLATLPPEQLEALAELAIRVKEEKLKAMQMSSEEIEKLAEEEKAEPEISEEEVVGEDEFIEEVMAEIEEGGGEVGEEEELAEGYTDSDRVIKRDEGLSEGSGRPDERVEQNQTV